MLFSTLREAANKKTLFLFSDCFNKSVYFTLLNSSAREEKHPKPFILQRMKIKTKTLKDPF